jgi:hypothetical protein
MIEKPIPVYQRSIVRLSCTQCGAEANASCDCNKPYVPAAQRVTEYDKANPGQSERTVAAELGISKTAVHEARASGGHPRPTEITGRDGKTYSLEHGRKQVIELQKHYGDPATYSLPPIQFDLIEQVKPAILRMNWTTKQALVMWIGEVYRKEIYED